MRVGALPAELKREFVVGKFAALYAGGPGRAVPPTPEEGSRRISNMWWFPVRFGITSAWEDTVSNTLDTGSWSVASGVLFRIWTEGKPYAGKLEEIVADGLGAEPLRKAWLNLGPDASTDKLKEFILLTAKQRRVRAWDDVTLIQELQLRYANRLRKGR